jgi:hypothetical protein
MEEQFEERYRDVLQNIEGILMPIYDQHPKMTDYGAIYVMETLIKVFNAELQGRTAAIPQFQPYEQEAFDSVRAICYWRMGRGKMTDANGREMDLAVEPKTAEEIIACLKRVHKSIQFWQKRGGRRAYYEYVKEFIGQ